MSRYVDDNLVYLPRKSKSWRSLLDADISIYANVQHQSPCHNVGLDLNNWLSSLLRFRSIYGTWFYYIVYGRTKHMLWVGYSIFFYTLPRPIVLKLHSQSVAHHVIHLNKASLWKMHSLKSDNDVMRSLLLFDIVNLQLTHPCYYMSWPLMEQLTYTTCAL